MKLALLAIGLSLGLTAPALATTGEVAQVSATELISDPAEWQGRTVSVTGELVGDYSYRDDGVWVQLNDDAYVDAAIGAGGEPVGANIGIGARVPSNEFNATELGGPGRHDRRGPLVTIVGTFFSNDSRLGGETYIDVTDLSIERSATRIDPSGPDRWLLVGMVLLVAAGAIAWRSRRGQDGTG